MVLVAHTIWWYSWYSCLTLSVQGHKKANPAADPCKMRRIIAEDPEWYVNTPQSFHAASYNSFEGTQTISVFQGISPDITTTHSFVLTPALQIVA